MYLENLPKGSTLDRIFKELFLIRDVLVVQNKIQTRDTPSIVKASKGFYYIYNDDIYDNRFIAKIDKAILKAKESIAKRATTIVKTIANKKRKAAEDIVASIVKKPKKGKKVIATIQVLEPKANNTNTNTNANT